ncbi:MAG: hypothetical protein IKS98_00990 [Lachnospiraceae bacterium]|nr:hypothetical protein [Lachnospiraceae bacterium]
MSEEEKKNLITALEASWEQEPLLMEDLMWTMIEDYICLYLSESVCI